MDFSDERWVGLHGGYRIPYDPRPSLAKLLENPVSFQHWSALWEDLYHQGDVGVASYAAVPTIAKIANLDSSGGWHP